MEKPRSFLLRHDVFTHPRTSWMRPDDGWTFACIASASILGVSTYSPRRLAKLTNVATEAMPIVLHALESHGLIRWWPDDEIAWAVERADESGVGGSSWLSAQREWREYPEYVQEAIADRYPILRQTLDRYGNPPATGGGDRGWVREDGATPQTPQVTVTVPVPVTVDPYPQVAAFRAEWTERLAAIKAELGPCTDPTRDPQAYAGLCEALEQHGHALVLAVTEWAVRKEPTGKLTATMFRGAGFGAHLDAYVASQKAERGRAMVAPSSLRGRSLTDAEQREWVKVASAGGNPEGPLLAKWMEEDLAAGKVADEVWP